MHVPPDFSGNPFLERAYNLDLCEPLFDQYQYESRLETEAEMMIALEAMRFAMMKLQEDILIVEDCYPPNTERIEENTLLIRVNDEL